MDSPRGRIQLMEAKLDGTLRSEPDDGDALRPLPRMPGLRLVLPVGRAVRPPHRGDARTLSSRSTAAPVASGSSVGCSSRRCRTRADAARAAARADRPQAAGSRLGAAVARRRATMAIAVAGNRSAPPDGVAVIGRVGLLAGCVQRAMFGDVNAATARVLAAAGYEVVVPRQGCCGALSAHAGRKREAERFTSALRTAFGGVDTIVVNSSGCGSHLKDHGACRVDLSEALQSGPLPELHPLELTVAYQDSCHLRHGQRLPAAWARSSRRSRGSGSSRPRSRISAAARRDLQRTQPERRASSATGRRRTSLRRRRTRSRAPTRAAWCRSGWRSAAPVRLCLRSIPSSSSMPRSAGSVPSELARGAPAVSRPGRCASGRAGGRRGRRT